MKQETTIAAFRSLINFLYDSPDYLSRTAGYQELSDLLSIARRYSVHRLVEDVEKMMEELPVAERKNGQGNALFSEEKYQEALVTFREALDNLGFEEEADVRLRSQILCNIGDCHFKLGRYKEALESFSEALGIDSTWEEPFMKMSDVMEKRLEKVRLGEQTKK